MYEQDWEACNLDLCTAGLHTTILWEVSCHGIKKHILHAVIWAQFMPFYIIGITSLLFAIILNIPKTQKCAFRCVFIAENCPIGTSGSVSIQATCKAIFVCLYIVAVLQENMHPKKGYLIDFLWHKCFWATGLIRSYLVAQLSVTEH